MSAAPFSSMLAALGRLASRHNIRVRGRCGCPLCNHVERDARAAIGMALKHPERLTRELPADQEDYLGWLADQAWPHEEYTAIIIELRGMGGQQ